MCKTYIELLAVEQNSKVENLCSPLGHPSVVIIPLKFPNLITNICRWGRLGLAYQIPDALVCVAIAGDGGERKARHAGLEKFTARRVCEYLSPAFYHYKTYDLFLRLSRISKHGLMEHFAEPPSNPYITAGFLPSRLAWNILGLRELSPCMQCSGNSLCHK